MDYVIHLCKNSLLDTKDENYCDRVWIDEDRTNAQMYPPCIRYCPECVKKGFKNPYRKKPLTDEQKAKLVERLKKAREAKKK